MRTFRPVHWALLLLSLGIFATSTPAQQLSQTDRIRLAESFQLAAALDTTLWPGWNRIPFPVLLVADSAEFLIHHPHPDSSFARAGYDSLLQAEVYSRPRQFPLTLMASFPFNGVPTTVIGQAQNTYLESSTPWVITLQHEHFHQFQNSHPEYFERVNALDLSGGDQTGMWMLNYPFPYDSSAVQQRFERLVSALDSALSAPDSQLMGRFQAYCAVRRDFLQSLAEADRKYFSFQVWQEGIAQYTEWRIANWAAANYTPSAKFRGLADFQPIGASAARLNRIMNGGGLSKASLASLHRVAFYLVGCAEGGLLDRIKPHWHDSYFTQMLTLDPEFEQ